MKKIWIGVIILLVAVLAIVLFLTRNKEEIKEIKIGAILPLTGDIASYGIRVKRGAEIATQELPQKGLPPVEIEFQDDQNNPRLAAGIMKTYATVKHYPVVMGAAGSSVSLAITPIANQYEMVQISPLSSAQELSLKGGDYFFRVCPADDQQAEILAKWVAEEGYNKVAVVYTDNDWGLGLAEAFRNYYRERSDGEIVFYEGTAEGEKDFRTVLTKIKAKDAEAIVSPTYPKEGGQLIRQVEELGMKVERYGADNWGASEFANIAGTASEGCKFVAQYSYSGPEFQRLNSIYKSQYQEEADVFVAYGYDTVYAIAYAADKAESWTGPEVRKALSTVTFQGASGYIEFDHQGDLKTEAFVRKIIKNGKPQDYKKEEEK